MADTPNAGDRRECQGEGLDVNLALVKTGALMRKNQKAPTRLRSHGTQRG
jgi:hypothetical protein